MNEALTHNLEDLAEMLQFPRAVYGHVTNAAGRTPERPVTEPWWTKKFRSETWAGRR